MKTKTKPKKSKLTERLRLLLPMGVKHAGSYNPEEALLGVEEQMTLDEIEVAMAFLQWVVDNKRTFGHNLPEVWAEYQATL